MLIGYARVSTSDQNLDPQLDALKALGCEKVFTDKATGANSDRAGLKEALQYLRAGDTLCVWKLDRLGRSLRDLIDIVKQLQVEAKGFRSIQEAIDTDSSAGKLFFHIVGALAEFERDIIRDRTKAGLSAARARGRLGGRPKAMDAKKQQIARSLYSSKQNSIREICETVGVSKATLYRYLPRTS